MWKVNCGLTLHTHRVWQHLWPPSDLTRCWPQLTSRAPVGSRGPQGFLCVCVCVHHQKTHSTHSLLPRWVQYTTLKYSAHTHTQTSKHTSLPHSPAFKSSGSDGFWEQEVEDCGIVLCVTVQTENKIILLTPLADYFSCFKLILNNLFWKQDNFLLV